MSGTIGAIRLGTMVTTPVPPDAEAMMKCERCFTELYTCPDCKGQTRTSLLGDRLTCSTCRSTGRLCRNDGGFWQR